MAASGLCLIPLLSLFCGGVRPVCAYLFLCVSSSLHLQLPIAPEGYAALGCVVAPSYDKPKLTDIRCVHKSLCVEAGAVAEHDGHCLWKDLGSGV